MSSAEHETWFYRRRNLESFPPIFLRRFVIEANHEISVDFRRKKRTRPYALPEKRVEKVRLPSSFHLNTASTGLITTLVHSQSLYSRKMKFAVTSLALIASASAFAPSTTAPVSYSNLNKARSQTPVARGEQNCGLELFQISQSVVSKQVHARAPL